MGELIDDDWLRWLTADGTALQVHREYLVGPRTQEVIADDAARLARLGYVDSAREVRPPPSRLSRLLRWALYIGGQRWPSDSVVDDVSAHLVVTYEKRRVDTDG